jgi:hypothetical protein
MAWEGHDFSRAVSIETQPGFSRSRFAVFIQQQLNRLFEFWVSYGS